MQEKWRCQDTDDEKRVKLRFAAGQSPLFIEQRRASPCSRGQAADINKPVLWIVKQEREEVLNSQGGGNSKDGCRSGGEMAGITNVNLPWRN